MTEAYVEALVIGLIVGMRSMTGLATLSSYLNHAPRAQRVEGPWNRLGGGPILTLLRVAQVGEMVADKTPWIPARITPGPLGGRTLFGALGGGIVARTRDEAVPIGVGIGAFGAVASSFTMYHLRQLLDRHLPDWSVGVAEDAIVTMLAQRWLRRVTASD